MSDVFHSIRSTCYGRDELSGWLQERYDRVADGEPGFVVLLGSTGLASTIEDFPVPLSPNMITDEGSLVFGRQNSTEVCPGTPRKWFRVTERMRTTILSVV